jgi:hypothetical protein
MTCPMTDKNISEYQLTDSQVSAFCKAGCSVKCQDLFKDYIAKRKPKEAGE